MNVATNINAISEQHFARIVSIAAQEAGLAIPDSKKSLVQSRVMRRMRKLGIEDCGVYLDGLASNADEKQELISVLTTNVSHFFREKHHFDTLRTSLLEPARSDRIRIWSAGCSTGQEPYSLAMTVLDTIPDAAQKNVLILASDIDPAVLQKATVGRYSRNELDGVEENRLAKYFERVSDTEYEAKPLLKEIIRFRKLNLNGAHWPMKGPFDAILCRNVVIYFNEETQSALWPRFRDLLAPNGILMLGHSERIHPIEGSGFIAAGVTTYQKTK